MLDSLILGGEPPSASDRRHRCRILHLSTDALTLILTGRMVQRIEGTNGGEYLRVSTIEGIPADAQIERMSYDPYRDCLCLRLSSMEWGPAPESSTLMEIHPSIRWQEYPIPKESATLIHADNTAGRVQYSVGELAMIRRAEVIAAEDTRPPAGRIQPPPFQGGAYWIGVTDAPLLGCRTSAEAKLKTMKAYPDCFKAEEVAEAERQLSTTDRVGDHSCGFNYIPDRISDTTDPQGVLVNHPDGVKIEHLSLPPTDMDFVARMTGRTQSAVPNESMLPQQDQASNGNVSVTPPDDGVTFTGMKVPLEMWKAQWMAKHGPNRGDK